MKEKEGCFYNVMERFPFSSEGPLLLSLSRQRTLLLLLLGERTGEQSANIPRIWRDDLFLSAHCGVASLRKETLLHNLLSVCL